MSERDVPKTRMEIIREQSLAYQNLPFEDHQRYAPIGSITGPRQCRKCYKVKPDAEMVRRNYWCKECQAVYLKAYNARNPEKQAKAKAAYYQRNKEKYREYSRTAYQRKKEAIAEYNAWKAAQQAQKEAS